MIKTEIKIVLCPEDKNILPRLLLPVFFVTDVCPLFQDVKIFLININSVSFLYLNLTRIQVAKDYLSPFLAEGKLALSFHIFPLHLKQAVHKKY
jgi:hypothetical protein